MPDLPHGRVGVIEDSTVVKKSNSKTELNSTSLNTHPFIYMTKYVLYISFGICAMESTDGQLFSCRKL